MWDTRFDERDVKEIRTKTTTYLGVGAIAKIGDIAADLKARGIDSILCVTGGHSYKITGAWDYVTAACANHGISADAKAVLCIGGGSPIDAGKSAAIILANPGKTAEELYTFAFTPTKAVPIVVVNLTHGTGSEVNRFAVASITKHNHKPAIAYDCLYPLFSIDDPGLMIKLSPKQTRYVSIDSVNHVIEAATAVTANPLSILLAGETIRLVAEYLPKALANPEDLKARYCLSYASMIAGTAFDNGLLHFTHALEHPLSGIKPELAHGLGLSMILPAIIEECYPACSATLGTILRPLTPDLKGTPDEAHKAARGVETWLADMGVPQKLEDEGFTENDIPRLCELTRTTPSLGLLLSVAPVPASPERIEKIYRRSLKKMDA